MTSYRWLETSEIEDYVNPVLKQRGYAELNLNEVNPTCRVLGAFLEDSSLVESFTFQMLPFLGPLLRHDNSIRDSGETSRQLATVMYDFLVGVDARDFLVIANSPISERLAERFGMKTVEVPVYMNHPGQPEVSEVG